MHHACLAQACAHGYLLPTTSVCCAPFGCPLVPFPHYPRLPQWSTPACGRPAASRPVCSVWHRYGSQGEMPFGCFCLCPLEAAPRPTLGPPLMFHSVQPHVTSPHSTRSCTASATAPLVSLRWCLRVRRVHPGPKGPWMAWWSLGPGGQWGLWSWSPCLPRGPGPPLSPARQMRSLPSHQRHPQTPTPRWTLHIVCRPSSSSTCRMWQGVAVAVVVAVTAAIQEDPHCCRYLRRGVVGEVGEGAALAFLSMVVVLAWRPHPFVPLDWVGVAMGQASAHCCPCPCPCPALGTPAGPRRLLGHHIIRLAVRVGTTTRVPWCQHGSSGRVGREQGTVRGPTPCS
jgi:hypothetical protein